MKALLIFVRVSECRCFIRITVDLFFTFLNIGRIENSTIDDWNFELITATAISHFNASVEYERYGIKDKGTIQKLINNIL
jgi:hypothetical protein